MSAVPLPAALSLSSRFGSIITALRRTLAARAGRDRAFAVILLVLWNRLNRLSVRVAAIAARCQAGTLRKSPTTRHTRASAHPPPPQDPLPRERGWLLRRVRESGVYGGHLRLLLAEPEMVAMIEAAPQLRRLIRPLWRMLKLEPPPPILQAPPASPPAPARRSRPRPRPARAVGRASPTSPLTPPAPGRLPLHKRRVTVPG